MNKWTAILAAALSLSLSTTAFATKIAVVDMQRALFQSDGAKASFKQVEDQFGDNLVKIKELEKELKTSQQKLQKDGAIMSDDEQRKLRNNVKEKQSEFQFHASKLQQAEQQWRQQFFRANMSRIREILQSIVDEEKVDIVLDGQAVLQVKPELDLTKKLLNKLNQAASAKK